MARETARTLLKIITGKEYVYFTPRCNKSIEIAMNVLADIGRTTVLFQEEGGWLTYEKYIQAAGLEPIKMVTNDGLVFDSEVARHDMNTALIINSLPGYIALQDMDSLSGVCASNDVMIINDVSGSIGLPESKVGDIIVGSFGDAKPVNLGSGGFIATDDYDMFQRIQEHFPDEAELQFILLEKKLRELDTRRSYLQKKVREIKADLEDMDIVHPEEPGLNVVVKYDDDEQKQRIIEYAKDNELEYTECPREIRVLDNAISIEVKRLS